MSDRIGWPPGPKYRLFGQSPAWQQSLDRVRQDLRGALPPESVCHAHDDLWNVYYLASREEHYMGYAQMVLDVADPDITVSVEDNERGAHLLQLVSALVPVWRRRYRDPTISMARVYS